MLETIRAARAKYGATCGDDECVAICNEVAWVHRAEGYGVSRKETGTRGRRYDGQECCHDVVMLRDGRYWDILGAAGGASVPQWQDSPSGVITDPARGWVAPIVPQGVVTPPVEPPVTPTLEVRVAKIEEWLRQLGRVTSTGWPL